MIARPKWVENPDIKKCALPVIPPKALCHNIQLGTILPIGSPMRQLLTSHRLQLGLCAHVVTYLAEEICCQVSNLTVTD